MSRVPTLLTTTKMHPELAARVRASVTGRKGSTTARRPRLVALARLAAILVVAFVVQSVVGVWRTNRNEVIRVRSEILATLRAQSSTLTDAELASPRRIEASLIALSRSYDHEVVAPELREPGALDATLARPLVYVRATLGMFASAKQIADAASSSPKDALVVCLLNPPSSRLEKDVLPKTRIAYSQGGALEARTPHVRTLHDAEQGLPFLTREYAARVEATSNLAELLRLKKAVDRAPLANAARAAKATLLLVAMDEPGEGGGPTELDGERRHHVRVALLNLANDKVLLDTRKLVNPSWISQAKRAELARGLDSCVLALDVREVAARR